MTSTEQRLSEALSALQWIASNADVPTDFQNQYIRLRQIHERASDALDSDHALLNMAEDSREAGQAAELKWFNERR